MDKELLFAITFFVDSIVAYIYYLLYKDSIVEYIYYLICRGNR